MNEAEYAMRNYADLVRVLFTLAEKIGRRAIDPSSSDNCHPTKRIVRYKKCLLLLCKMLFVVNLLTYTLRTYLYCRAALELARPTGHAWSAVCLARGN